MQLALRYDALCLVYLPPVFRDCLLVRGNTLGQLGQLSLNGSKAVDFLAVRLEQLRIHLDRAGALRAHDGGGLFK